MPNFEARFPLSLKTLSSTFFLTFDLSFLPAFLNRAPRILFAG